MDFPNFELPVVDLDRREAAVLKTALYDFGFFYLKTSLVSTELLERVYAEMRRFFEQPVALKNEALANKYNRGYNGFQDEILDPTTQKGGDLKEGYYVGREVQVDAQGEPILTHPLAGPNVWPPTLDDHWKQTMLEYYEVMLKVGFETAKMLALALELPEDFFTSHLTDPVALLRLLHYSNDVSRPDAGLFGAGAHTDYGLLTFLSTDGTPGLQIRFEGEWYNVPHRPGCFVVNIGDMVQRWTNDVIKSTWHRVVKLVPVERYAIPFFYEPDFYTSVECLPQFCREHPARYPPTTSGEHLLSKYGETQVSFVDPRHPPAGSFSE